MFHRLNCMLYKKIVCDLTSGLLESVPGSQMIIIWSSCTLTSHAPVEAIAVVKISSSDHHLHFSCSSWDCCCRNQGVGTPSCRGTGWGCSCLSTITTMMMEFTMTMTMRTMLITSVSTSEVGPWENLPQFEPLSRCLTTGLQNVDVNGFGKSSIHHYSFGHEIATAVWTLSMSCIFSLRELLQKFYSIFVTHTWVVIQALESRKDVRNSCFDIGGSVDN